MLTRPVATGLLCSAKRFLDLPPALRRSFWSTANASAPATTTGPELYDVVCVGGGPAGLSLVSALRAHPSTQALKIALIDSQDLSTSKTPSGDAYSNRCSSLTPSSLRFLQQMGVWDKISTSRTQAYHGMDVWDGVSGSKIHFDPMDQTPGLLDSIAAAIPGSRFGASRQMYEQGGAVTVATMCENTNLTAGLLERMRGLKGVEILDRTKVESIDLGPEPADEQSLDLSQWPVVTLSLIHI